MIDLDLDALQGAFGLGVAGNFAGHLEQAGEAGDFVSVDAAPEAPKGIFPWFVPGGSTFLGTFPLASERVVRPAGDVNLQIEPEVGAVCRVTYEDDVVTGLAVEAIAAFNDCSIRREGARKISEKKNWGPASKGLASRGFEVDALPPDAFRLACFLRRDGKSRAYGVDSPLTGYSYYATQLLDWIVERLQNQKGSEDTPLEDVGGLLASAGCPEQVVIGIGATRYTEVGESTYLQDGDESIVIVYDERQHGDDAVADAVAGGREDDLPAASVLRQVVEEG